MQKLKGLEQHSYNSLAKRLGHYVSRQTLKTWIDSGTIRPALQRTSSRNSHLLFPTAKLNQLRDLLKQAHEERLGRSGESAARVARMRQNALASARQRAEENERREARGRQPLPGLEPAMNDDDARGLTRLTLTDAKIEGIQRIFSGYGLYR